MNTIFLSPKAVVRSDAINQPFLRQKGRYCNSIVSVWPEIVVVPYGFCQLLVDFR